MFEDRIHAGTELAAALKQRAIDVDLVLAIPRGGLPLGRVIADELGVPLDVIIAKKIGAPSNPEYAIGAVASDGSTWRNEAAIEATGAGSEYFERKRREVAAAARKKAERYRGGDPEPDLSGKSVVVTDDGVATGSTARACLSRVQNAGAESVILAVPVGPPDTIAELSSLATDVVCLEQPASFRSVGAHYDSFLQVSDEEAIGYLEE